MDFDSTAMGELVAKTMATTAAATVKNLSANVKHESVQAVATSQ